MIRRSTLVGVVMALVVPLAMVATARDAVACSCAPSGSAVQVERSDVAFVGEAIARDESASGVSGADPVTWTFGVDHVLKGAAAEPQAVVTAESEASCGIEFAPGTTYLVLGTRVGATGPVSTGLCSGTRPLSTVPPAGTAAPGSSRPG